MFVIRTCFRDALLCILDSGEGCSKECEDNFMSLSVVAGLLLVIVVEIALIVAFRRQKTRKESQ